MSTILVTGAAGFVGSHVAITLASQGHEVIALDCFLPDLYSAQVKRERFKEVSETPGITPVVADLRTDDLSGLPRVDVVINEAAMPGLTKSWEDLRLYVDNNLHALDRLISATTHQGLEKFIQVSTSSVYGRVATGSEDSPTDPFSPYGVSKLAAEKLGFAHRDNFGLPFTVLRYFSVYGPGQRPDMAYHRFLEKAKTGEKVVVYGDGEQRRTNTYVADCVDATISAIDRATPGQAYNISGSESVSINDALQMMREVTGAALDVDYLEPRAGDQRETRGDISKARFELGYDPVWTLKQGLEAQWEWQKDRQFPTV
jgi:nucleoside-diphosphate-sugar epimerase